jgi:hypothetical protein
MCFAMSEEKVIYAAGKAHTPERKFRLQVGLTKEEHEALKEYSEKQTRHPRDQAALLLRKALIDVGALKLPEKRTGRD